MSCCVKENMAANSFMIDSIIKFLKKMFRISIIICDFFIYASSLLDHILKKTISMKMLHRNGISANYESLQHEIIGL